MKKNNIILNSYVLIKIALTFFVPYICIFGIFTIPFSISIGLNDGLYKHIARILILLSSLWIFFLVMNIIPKPKIKRIARIGIMVMSFLEVMCLLSSIVFGFVTLDSIGRIITMAIFRLLAILENVLCILYCSKRYPNKFIRERQHK